VKEESNRIVKEEPTPSMIRASDLFKFEEPSFVGKEETSPVDKEESSPVDKEEPSSVDKEEPSPVGKEESSLVNKEEQSPVDKEESGRFDEGEPGRVYEEESTSAEKEEPSRVDKGGPKRRPGKKLKTREESIRFLEREAMRYVEKKIRHSIRLSSRLDDNEIEDQSEEPVGEEEQTPKFQVGISQIISSNVLSDQWPLI
jgi:hypothetical protein